MVVSLLLLLSPVLVSIVCLVSFGLACVGTENSCRLTTFVFCGVPVLLYKAFLEFV